MSDFLLSQPLFTDDSAAMIVAEYLQIINLQPLLDDTHYSQKTRRPAGSSRDLITMLYTQKKPGNNAFSRLFVF